MPTLAGLRRRGYTPEALRDFCERVGVARNNSTVDFALLEHVLREDLDRRSPRALAVLRPLRVVVESWPDDRVETLDAPYWPADARPVEGTLQGTRPLPMSRVLYIDRDDFMESPPRDYHRLAPGREVRLRHGYVIRCDRVVKDERTGEIVELRCSHDPATRGADPAGRKVKGTIQWVSAAHAVEAEVRVYDRLFLTDAPGSTGAWMDELNPNSLATVRARLEPSLASARPGDRFQFERLGFFFADPLDSKPGAPVFNRTVALKDTWAKQARADAAPARPSTPEAPKPAPAAPKAEAPAPLGPEAQQLRDRHGLPAEDARILAADAGLHAFFEEAVATHPSAANVARFIVNEVLGKAKAGVAALPFRGAAVGELCALVDAGTISGKMAKDVLAAMLEGGGSPRAIVEKQGMVQISDAGAIDAAVDAVLAENADAVARYRAGNANLLGAFVGMVMKKTGGKANPKLVNERLRARLA
jgi:glutaminyl-tRNA synthetase